MVSTREKSMWRPLRSSSASDFPYSVCTPRLFVYIEEEGVRARGIGGFKRSETSLSNWFFGGQLPNPMQYRVHLCVPTQSQM